MSEKQNDTLNLDPETHVLRDDELDAVSGGGKASFNDFNFTHLVDKASPIQM